MAETATILLIDDEPTVAKLYGSVLQNRGFSVRVYSGANEALEGVHSHRPRLVMTDVQMPGMDGFEFCGHLRRRGKKTFPILFVTGDDKPDVIGEGLAAGGDDFLLKGMPLNDITGRVVFWLAAGFRGLPKTVREQTNLALSKHEAPLGIDSLALDHDLLDAVTPRLQDELAQLPDFGMRLVERILLLGRISHLILEHSADARFLLRFPDHMVALINRLELPWRQDMGALLAHYDLFARDERFLAAGPRPLQSYEAYEAVQS